MITRLHQPSIRLGCNPPEWSQFDGEQRVTTTCTGCSVSVDEPLVVEIETKNGLVSTLDKKVPVARGDVEGQIRGIQSPLRPAYEDLNQFKRKHSHRLRTILKPENSVP